MEQVKLIRDKMPLIIERTGKKCYCVKLINYTNSTEEYKSKLKYYLDKKLNEEVGELIAATSKKDKIEELADIIEVLKEYAAVNDISESEVLEVLKKKHEERGGFKDHIILLGIK